MKKLLGLLLASCLALGALAGCAPAKAETPQEPVMITEVPVAETPATQPQETAPATDGAVTPLPLTALYQYPNCTENDRWLCGGRCITLAPAQEQDVSPALVTAMREFMTAAQTTAQAAVDAEAPAARAARSADPQNFSYTQLDTHVYALRADSRAVSVLQVNERTADGQTQESYACATWDTQTGAALTLEDVVADRAGLAALIAQRCMVSEAARCAAAVISVEALTERVEAALTEQDGQTAWNLGYQGMSFCFAPGCGLLSDSGRVTIELPYALTPELLAQASYLDTPAAYVIPFRDTLRFDIDGDGTGENIAVKPVEDEFGNYNGVNVAVNGAEYTLEDWCYELTPYLVYGGEGNVNVYVETRTDNDYRSVDMFRLTPGGVESAQSVLSGFADVPCDPADIMLETRFAMLSTYTGSRHYTLGADGLPAPREAWYAVDSQIVLTAKQPLTLALVGEDGAALGERELAAGSRVTIVRTDGASWVDLRAEDGALCRVTVNGNTWPQTVNGQDAESCFDGMAFAG